MIVVFNLYADAVYIFGRERTLNAFLTGNVFISDPKRGRGLDNQHQHNIVGKKPFLCEECHRTEAPLLPFKQLGYPQHRVDTITSTEVIGMIKNYTQFYIPNILEPEAGSEAPRQ